MHNQADAIQSHLESMQLTCLQQHPCNALLPVPLVHSHVGYHSSTCWSLWYALVAVVFPNRDSRCAHYQVLAAWWQSCSICKQILHHYQCLQDSCVLLEALILKSGLPGCHASQHMSQ